MTLDEKIEALAKKAHPLESVLLHDERIDGKDGLPVCIVVKTQQAPLYLEWGYTIVSTGKPVNVKTAANVVRKK